MKILIANSNPIHARMADRLREKYDVLYIDRKEDLSVENIQAFGPDYIFFPHWSFIIPAGIYDAFTCIVFHMTDLPYGRGGSPLQNLIKRGHQSTRISALRVVEQLDAGDIYLKKELSLLGTAEEIFLRLGQAVEVMIDEIVSQSLQPVSQTGEVTEFKRLKPKDGDISQLRELEKIFDFIRMLDAEGYPPAFLETENLRLEFNRASLKKDHIIADVRIFKK